MNITLTPDEYSTLLGMMEIARNVISSGSTEDDHEHLHFEKLDQKLLSLADSFNKKESVTYDEATKMYTRAESVQQEAQTHLDIYDSETFFVQLIDNLTLRDIISQFGEEALKTMPAEERIARYQDIQKIYINEFEQNGIDNLSIRS